MFIIHAAQLDPDVPYTQREQVRTEVRHEVRSALYAGRSEEIIEGLNATQSAHPECTDDMIDLLLDVLGSRYDLPLRGISNVSVFRWIISHDTSHDLVHMLNKMIGIVNPNGSRNEADFICTLSEHIRALPETDKMALITQLRSTGGLRVFLELPATPRTHEYVRSSIATLKALLLELDSTYPAAT